jgi:L-rhamnose mutarotase
MHCNGIFTVPGCSALLLATFGYTSEDPITHTWWEITDPMQTPVGGNGWKNLEEV